MTLWEKLEKLGYGEIMIVPSDEYPYGGCASNFILGYFKRNLTLRECKLIKKEHEVELREYY